MASTIIIIITKIYIVHMLDGKINRQIESEAIIAVSYFFRLPESWSLTKVTWQSIL